MSAACGSWCPCLPLCPLPVLTAPALPIFCSPHVTVAQYTQEMVVPGNQLLIQCQTSGAITPEQGMVESLQITKQIFNAIGVSAR